MSEPYRYDPQYPQPQRKGTSPLAIVGIGCGLVLSAGIAFVAFVFTIVFGALRSSAPFKDSVARAKSDPRVLAVLGSPVETSPFFTGSVNTTNDTGNANLTIGLKGPKGKAKLHVVGTRANYKWTYSEMTVTPEKSGPINLLASPTGSTSRALPGD